MSADPLEIFYEPRTLESYLKQCIKCQIIIDYQSVCLPFLRFILRPNILKREQSIAALKQCYLCVYSRHGVIKPITIVLGRSIREEQEWNGRGVSSPLHHSPIPTGPGPENPQSAWGLAEIIQMLVHLMSFNLSILYFRVFFHRLEEEEFENFMRAFFGQFNPKDDRYHGSNKQHKPRKRKKRR